ncbi:3-phosphoshikimate 1-carboxyvinyltransferase [Thermodesulfovibrionales bacterium]|nr:3-phosphoshikimate 1-carboxyvinyltransferase [Thermodesulfovibrionales bacterium]MCL0050025.1 3-phosphoshikimate 1-carboxyvinyltransferase [Thermodesulfovibrionales bacterium]
MDQELAKARGFKGEISVPPDKSISHRAVMLASLSEGKSVVRNFLMAEDPISTMNAMKMLGTEIKEENHGEITIKGRGLYGLKEPLDVINCNNSGTTIRLISGILAGNPFFSVLTGDSSLRQRPVARIINPLKDMGADISGRNENKYPPIAIKGRRLNAINYTMPVASAQIKSCLILAALYADGTTVITEPFKSRDHTERMLASTGVEIEVNGFTIKVNGQGPSRGLNAFDITIPADFSSAAFFIVAATIIPNSEILIKNVGINPTRTGLLEVIREMGASVRLEDIRDVSGEPVANIYCKTADCLKAAKISEETIPSLIDEFPALCVLATQAEGITEIRGAEELRVKETDRIKAMMLGLKKLGAEVKQYHDGVAIKGKAALKGSHVESYGDHRIAMSLSIAALVAEGTTTINNASCVNVSFPGFYEELKGLTF